MTLTDFLIARIADDEAVARAASSPPWTALTFYPNRSEVTNETEIDGGRIVTTPRKNDADVTHIARHDPARVLAECERDRRIVALHPLNDGPNYRGTDCCRRCTADGEYPADDAYTDEQNWPCPTLRALAAVYAEHPDYREEWKP